MSMLYWSLSQCSLAPAAQYSTVLYVEVEACDARSEPRQDMAGLDDGTIYSVSTARS